MKVYPFYLLLTGPSRMTQGMRCTLHESPTSLVRIQYCTYVHWEQTNEIQVVNL